MLRKSAGKLQLYTTINVVIAVFIASMKAVAVELNAVLILVVWLLRFYCLPIQKSCVFPISRQI